MKKEDYTLLDLAEIFGENKQFIRRRITKLKLVAINKDTREYYNEPLKYNYDSYLKLAKELGYKNDICLEESEIKNDTHVTQNVTRNDTRVTHDDTQKKQDNNDKDKLIEILERELEHSKDKLKKSEEEKEKLMTLLDQQQRLSLQANQKIEILENKEEIKEEVQKNKDKKWWKFF